jgi:hypothetical protein
LSETKFFSITNGTFIVTFFPLLSIHWKNDKIYQDTTQKWWKHALGQRGRGVKEGQIFADILYEYPHSC